MAKDNGTESLKSRELRPPPPMKFLDESHPIFSNPSVITSGFRGIMGPSDPCSKMQFQFPLLRRSS